MKAVYKLNISMPRSADLEGVFIEEKENVEYLLNSDLVVGFGEVAGKHSDVAVKLKPEHIKFITDDEKVVEIMETHELCSGLNPFEYCATYSSLGEEAEIFCDCSISELIEHKKNKTFPE